MKLRLLRHPRTSASPGLCYGKTDVPVPPEATREVAERMALQLPDDIAMACSPLARCAELAQAIAGLRPALRVVKDPRIAEMDFGAWEARPWSAIERGDFDAWMRDFADARPGGTGESTREFMHRVGLAYDDWRSAGRDALWLTHAGVIRAVWLLAGGTRYVERADQWPSQPIAFGECVTVEL